MSKKDFGRGSIFRGAATALVTPFSNGRLDHPALERMIDIQIESKIDALVVVGTTGEAPSLSRGEQKACISLAVEQSGGRVPIIAGVGGNNLKSVIKASVAAHEAGADALLVVTPYYNKGNDEGLIRFFTAVADSTPLPVIIYTVPSRTGVKLTLPIYRELAKHERIVGVKEASGDVSAVCELVAELGDELDIYCGNDDIVIPILSLGGAGVISVASNIIPSEMHDLCQSYLTGDTNAALSIQLKYLKLIKALFSEVNPIPVKYAMSLLGLCKDEYRLPLAPPEEKTKALISSLLDEYGFVF